MIIKDGIFYILGEVVSKAVPFLLLPFMTKILGVEGIANLIYYTSIVAVFVLVLGLSQDGAVTRYFFRYGRRSLQFPVYFSFVYSTILFIFISLICVVIDNSVLLVCALAAYTSVLFTMQLTLQQCQKNSIRYFYMQITHAVFSVSILLLIFNYYAESPENRIISIAMANFIAAALGMFLIFKNGGLIFNSKVSFRNLKLAGVYILGFGIPLFFHQFSLISKNHIDKLLLIEYMDIDTFGVYAVSFQLASALSVFILAINKAFLPYYYEGLKNNKWFKKDIIKLVVVSLIVFQGPGLISILIPEVLYMNVFGNKFGMMSNEIPPLLMGFGLIAPYLLLVNYFFYHGKTALISFSTIFSSSLYLVLLVVFVFFNQGLIKYTLVISNLVLFAILFMFFYRAKYEK